MEHQQQHRWVFTVVNIVLLLLAFHVVLKLFPIEAPKPVSYSDFLAELRSGKLSDIQVTERELIGVRKRRCVAPHSGRRTDNHRNAVARCG